MNPQTFFKHFERLTDAPNAVARLRQLILQLAVQGKLVEQDERDEPAARLLERIGTERKRLVREKKIKETKPLPPVSNDEKPFEIPDSWQWVRLDDVCSYIQRGKSPKYVDRSDFPVIAQKCIQWDGLKIERAKFICPDSLAGYDDERFLRTDDLLINSTGTGTLGRAIVYKHESHNFDKVVADSHVTVIRPMLINSTFLFLWLTSPTVQGEIEAKSSGSTNQIELSTATVKSHLFPLPPLEEQKRTVAKVDELMRLCDELERVQAERRETRQRLNRAVLDRLLAARDATEFQVRWQTITDNLPTLTAAPDQIGKLRQTVLQLAVQGKLTRQDPRDEAASVLLQRIRAERERLVKEKKLKRADPLPPVTPSETPFALPSGWTWARISETCEIGTGSTPLTSNPAYYADGDVPWVTSAATSQVFIDDADTYITQAAVRDYRLRVYPPETLIVALYGQGKTRGQISQLKVAAAINQACAAISFTDTYREMAGYVRLFFEKSYVELRSLAAGGAQPNLNLIKIKETLMPLPPLEEQKRIVATVNRLMALCDELEAGLRRAEEDSRRLLDVAVRSLLASAPGSSMRVPALA